MRCRPVPAWPSGRSPGAFSTTPSPARFRGARVSNRSSRTHGRRICRWSGTITRWQRPGVGEPDRRTGTAVARGFAAPLRVASAVSAFHAPLESRMPTSAGLLLYRTRDDELEVLLVHPGGPFFANKDAGVWTIPKGMPDENEDLLECAKREFCE